MTLRACLRLLLLAAMFLAPIGRIGIAQAMAAPAATGTAMAGHCADMPAASAHEQGGHHQKSPERNGEGMAVDCMTACAAMVVVPAPFFAPPPSAVAILSVPLLPGLSGIQPEADPPPPRFS
jgi:hypothetical protein